MISLSAASPATVRVVREAEDGSGVVEIPMLSTGKLSLGETELDVTDAMLGDLAANFADYPGPVPVGPSPHVGYGERSGPQLGFVESLWSEAGKLWGRLALTAPLMAQVRAGLWRGFSVEMVRNLSHPSRKFSGWVLVGGVFTNRPASDVVFKVAAEADPGDVAVIHSGLSAEEVSPMSEQKVIGLEVHEAKVAELSAKFNAEAQKASALEARVTALEADARNLSAARADLEAKLTESRNASTIAQARANTADAQVKSLSAERAALATRLTESETKLKEVSNRETSDKVKAAVEKAVATGVPPAMFDGYAADPAAWLNANYASLEAFEKNIATLCAVGPKVPLKQDAVKSGVESRTERTDRSDVALTDDEKKALAKAGVSLDVSFVGVTTEEEARQRFEAAKAAKK